MRDASCAQRVEIARLEIFAIAHLHRIAEPLRQLREERSSAATKLSRACAARPELEDQHGHARAVGLQRFQKHRRQRIRVQIRLVASARARPIARMLGEDLRGDLFGNLQRESQLAPARSRTASASIPASEIDRRRNRRRRWEMFRRTPPGTPPQTSFARIGRAWNTARAYRSGPSQPSYFQELVPIQMPSWANVRSREPARGGQSRTADRTAAASRSKWQVGDLPH